MIDDLKKQLAEMTKDRDNWKRVAQEFARPYHCGSDCPCYDPEEGPSEFFSEFPECWEAKNPKD